jgi:hypothetical protein
MKNKIFIILTIVAGVLGFTSCLDDTADNWKVDVAGKSYATVMTPQLQSMGLKPVKDSVEYEFMINIATDVLPTVDITIKMKIDPAAVTAYNKQKGLTGDAAYKVYPNLKIVNPTVVISKGTRTAMVKCKVWGADALNACDNYIAAVTIDQVSGGIPIASNMKSYIMALPISNPYEGNYHCVGYRIRPGNATEPQDAIEAFKTINCKTVQKTGFGNYSAYDIVIEVTDVPMVVGGVTCYKVNALPINPTTGAGVGDMFATWTGDAATTPAPPANPTEINYYNPVTKTFVLNCWYASSAGNRIMYEVLTRQ